MANYPSAVSVFPSRSDGQTIFAADTNALQDEIAAIEASLIGGAVPNPLRVASATRPTLVVDTTGTPSKGRVTSNVPGVVALTNNISYDGTNRNLDDITAPGVELSLSNTGQLLFLVGAAGANPRPVVAQFTVTLAGAILERARSVALGEPQAYTPTWTATGTAPVLGNGTIIGLFCEIGRMVFFQIRLTWGSTTAATGAGSWTFSFPRAMSAVWAGNGSFTGWAFDSSATLTWALAVRNVGTTTCAAQPALSAGSGNISGTSVPFIWASGDVLEISGSYFQ